MRVATKFAKQLKRNSVYKFETNLAKDLLDARCLLKELQATDDPEVIHQAILRYFNGEEKE